MNIPRLLLTIIAGFLLIFATDFLIHGFWLAADYKATSQLWRPDAEMQSRFHWMVAGQLLCAVSFVIVWAKWIASSSFMTGAVFGFWLGILQQVWAIAFYVVAPLPGEIAAKWFAAGLVQAVLLGIMTAALYLPAVASREPQTV